MFCSFCRKCRSYECSYSADRINRNCLSPVDSFKLCSSVAVATNARKQFLQCCPHKSNIDSNFVLADSFELYFSRIVQAFVHCGDNNSCTFGCSCCSKYRLFRFSTVLTALVEIVFSSWLLWIVLFRIVQVFFTLTRLRQWSFVRIVRVANLGTSNYAGTPVQCSSYPFSDEYIYRIPNPKHTPKYA